MGLKPQPFRSRLLVYVPLIAALYMFAWPTAYKLFFSADSESHPSRNSPIGLVTENFWETFPSAAVAILSLFFLSADLLNLFIFLGQKGFCRPTPAPTAGFLESLTNWRPEKIRVTDACNQCGHCTATCTSNVLVHQEVRDFKMVVDPGCMKCMDCISVCPNDALYFGFGIPAIAAPKTKTPKRTYSLTWPEELLGAAVFLGSLLGVRSVYGLVPFLMALGCAAVTTFLFLKTWRLLRASDVFFHRFNLKSSGKMQEAGRGFLAFSLAWLALSVHSGWIRYHEYQGDRAFQRLQIPDELALAQANPAPWLSPMDRETILEGKTHFQTVSRFGLFVNGEALPKLAWFEYLSGNAGQAVNLLSQAASYQKGQSKAVSLYYRGTILNRLGRYDQANASFDEALMQRDDLILARQEKGESLWQLGRKDEAVSVWTDALQRNERLVLVGNQLAGAKRSMGLADEAASLEKMQVNPRSSARTIRFSIG